jgi:hypothetical protein
MNENEIGTACSTKTNANEILVEEHEGNKPVWISRYRSENNTKIDLKRIG